MNAQEILKISLISIFGAFLFSNAWASVNGKVIELASSGNRPNANGSAVIDTNHLNIQARGLKPNSVYTVWFVNEKPQKNEIGAGTAPYMFHTDQRGNGSYSSLLGTSPFGKWSLIMVVMHPDGDPTNMKDIVGTLKGRLLQRYSEKKAYRKFGHGLDKPIR